MGLPVPAERVRLQRFDDLHYHAKTQGTLDAGAFESTVREFADLAQGGEGSLVLVDELESITEPGASAKIIAGILEALSANGATAVFVSHLAGEIREMADYDVTVDGIEAVGLVDGALEVNRSPVKDHLARSTPELIVEKLAGEARTTRSRLTAARPQTARATRTRVLRSTPREVRVVSVRASRWPDWPKPTPVAACTGVCKYTTYHCWPTVLYYAIPVPVSQGWVLFRTAL